MLSGQDLLRLQREQFAHDKRNHFDILCLAKHDRLKHYGLHFSKYVGRLARGSSEPKPVERTITDAFLVCLSAANTLHQRLDALGGRSLLPGQVDPIRPFADAAGRFADACEKIDHLEEFSVIAINANIDILRWLLAMVHELNIVIDDCIRARRRELADRQFFIDEID